MVGWHHRLDGHEFEPAPGYGEGQGDLVCCSPWGCKESDMTEQLNNNNKLKTTNFWPSRFSMISKFHSSVDKNISKKKKAPFCFDNLMKQYKERF